MSCVLCVDVLPSVFMWVSMLFLLWYMQSRNFVDKLKLPSPYQHFFVLFGIRGNCLNRETGSMY